MERHYNSLHTTYVATLTFSQTQLSVSMRRVLLLTALLVHVHNYLVAGQKLQDILKSGPSRNMTLRNIFWGIDLTNIVASESNNQLSSSHWSICHAFHHCLPIRHSSNYKAYLHGALLCLKQYYQFCIQGNAVAQVQELKSRHAPECMRFKFSETTRSRDAQIWDIYVPLEFHINLTVTDLQLTYHPVECHDSQARDGRYTGQGLAIDNYATLCERTKQHSYLLPMSQARMILNYTRIPDRPVLEFMYEAITKQGPTKSYLTLFRLTFLNVFYFDLFQNTKNRLIIYLLTNVRFAMSLVNVTMRCENNFNRGNKLKFIDGPIFLATSYHQTYALIAYLDCTILASNATDTPLKGNKGQYLHLEQVKASIGELTAILEGPGIDISTLNFSFRYHIPDTPYGNVNVIDYTKAEPGTSESLTANLPVQGRHFHVLYWLQTTNSSFQSKPRLMFRIKDFDMVSFRDGCHSGGIFINEGFTNIASYCSQAGITFLNSTSETGGILFGVSPLVLILKGYSWFANIKLNISIIYDSCFGVTNICDKFRDNWLMFDTKCRRIDNVLCRYVTPRPCIEMMQLPSDGVPDYSVECTIHSHITSSPDIGYIQFANMLHLTFAIKGNLDFQEGFPLIFPEYILEHLLHGIRHYFDFYSATGHTRLQLNKHYTLRSRSVFINIKNTVPWLGIGNWIRLIKRQICAKEAVTLQPLEPLQIPYGCGTVGITSVTGHAKISINRSLFRSSMYFSRLYQCLKVAIFLLRTQDVSNDTTEGFFNAKLQSCVGGLRKYIVYTKRQYLELIVFSQSPTQEFSIELEWSSSLDGLQLDYMRRPEEIADKSHDLFRHPFNANWIRVTPREVCSRETSSCYRYHESSDVMSDRTWNIAQVRCAEQNSNLVSINSIEEWHLLLQWAYNLNYTNSDKSRTRIGTIGPFKGQLLFIGQRRMDVSNLVFFFLLFFFRFFFVQCR